MDEPFRRPSPYFPIMGQYSTIGPFYCCDATGTRTHGTTCNGGGFLSSCLVSSSASLHACGRRAPRTGDLPQRFAASSRWSWLGSAGLCGGRLALFRVECKYFKGERTLPCRVYRYLCIKGMQRRLTAVAKGRFFLHAHTCFYLHRDTPRPWLPARKKTSSLRATPEILVGSASSALKNPLALQSGGKTTDERMGGSTRPSRLERLRLLMI